jgi:hypothetical protein
MPLIDDGGKRITNLPKAPSRPTPSRPPTLRVRNPDGSYSEVDTSGNLVNPATGSDVTRARESFYREYYKLKKKYRNGKGDNDFKFKPPPQSLTNNEKYNYWQYYLRKVVDFRLHPPKEKKKTAKRPKKVSPAPSPKYSGGSSGSSGGSGGGGGSSKVKQPKTNTKPPGKAVQTAANVAVDYTQQDTDDALDSYLAIASVELFQYSNQVTIDGMISDVQIINVLSTLRDSYAPNTIFDKPESLVKSVELLGTDPNGYLSITIEDDEREWTRCVISLKISTAEYEIAETVD